MSPRRQHSKSLRSFFRGTKHSYIPLRNLNPTAPEITEVDNQSTADYDENERANAEALEHYYREQWLQAQKQFYSQKLRLHLECETLNFAKCLIVSGLILMIFGLSMAFGGLSRQSRQSLFQSFLPRNLLASKMAELPTFNFDDIDEPRLVGPGSFVDQSALCLDGRLPEPNEAVEDFGVSQVFNQFAPNASEYVDGLVKRLANKYFAKIQYSIMRRSCYPKFLVFRCTSELLCGGLGDRLRGIVGMFYLALATNRILHIHWDKAPARLQQFYRINAELYFADYEHQSNSNFQRAIQMYEHKLELSRKRYNSARVTFLDRQDELRYIDFVGRMLHGNLSSVTPASRDPFVETAEYLEFNTNSFIAITALFPVPSLISNDTRPNVALIQFYEEYFAEEIDRRIANYRKMVANIPLLLSAGVRLLFSAPQPRLERAFASFIAQSTGTIRAWRRLTKIGLQVRTGVNQYEDIHGRVEHDEEQNCFAAEADFTINFDLRLTLDQIGQLAKHDPNYRMEKPLSVTQKYLIFVTSDNDNTTDYIIDLLVGNYSLRAVRSSGMPLHLDKTDTNNEKADDDDSQKLLVLESVNRPFLDFYILSTQMQQLVISRSGFGEMAALAALKPTRRFRKDGEKFGRPMCYFYDWSLPTLNMEKKK